MTEEEVDLLEKEFSEEEVKEAVFGSYADGAPGPNGFSFLFYQTFWEVIKKDLKKFVNSFEKDQLNLDRLNYAMTTLIPKEPEAKTLMKFRPLSLINCSFKIFAKILNNRLVVVDDRLIASNQTTFIKGRYIMESVVAAHEIIHEVYRNKEDGVILKLDYENLHMTKLIGISSKKCLGQEALLRSGLAGASELMIKIVATLNLGRA